MKSQTGRILVSLFLGTLILGILGPTAHAQRVTRLIDADIPFDFTVGSQVFPAGRYGLKTIEPSQLELRDTAGHVLARVLTQSVQTFSRPAAPKLVFDSTSGEHVLTQVWQADESIGQEIPPSKSVTRAVRKRSGHVQTAEANHPR
jgi:hypothetical protein